MGSTSHSDAAGLTLKVGSVVTIVGTVLGAYIHIVGEIKAASDDLDVRLRALQTAVQACETRERALAKYEDTRDDLEEIRIAVALIREKQEEQRSLSRQRPPE